MTHMENANPLQILVGRELTSITFVAGYVQLHFDGPLMNVMNQPIVETGTSAHQFGDINYNNALINLIGSPVVEADLHEGLCARISFPGNRAIVVPLDPNSYRDGPEAIIFYPDERNFSVW